ncbi:MAG: RAMP superfamily CRISPR-associated protein [Candidatus Korarchaeum sp.]
MKSELVEGVLVAVRPICHGGDEKTGMETILRRLKFSTRRGLVEIPYISGNAIRGKLRRLVMRDFLELVGYQVRNPRLYHALFAGGVLEEVEEGESGKVDLELRRRVRFLIPPISLFGTSIGNQVFQGKLIVGHALPVCEELQEYLPESLREERSIYEFLDFEFATRKEEEAFKESRKDPKEEKVQMIYRFEVFIPGTRFYHNFKLLETSDVEDSLFLRALDLWKASPYVGGRESAGFGEIRIDYRIPSSLEKKRGKYEDFVAERRNEIRMLLGELDV